MNTTEATQVEASVEAVREQVKSLARRRHPSDAAPTQVRLRRVEKPRPCWRITARIAEPRNRKPAFFFTPHEVELGNDRIVLPEHDGLIIVSAGLKDDTLTLCIAEATQALREADKARTEGNELLRTATQALARLNEPARRIAATRAVRAVSNAIAHSPIQALTEAAAAATDVEVLIRALQQPDAIEAIKADDPLGPARLRGVKERERLLTTEGGTLSADEVARHLDISRQAVNKRRQQGTLVALQAGRHGYRYPAWQFVREGTLAGLEPVLDALKDHDPWMRHIFMVGPNTRLNAITPVVALRKGQLEGVLKAARAFGEHGAA